MVKVTSAWQRGERKGGFQQTHKCGVEGVVGDSKDISLSL